MKNKKDDRFNTCQVISIRYQTDIDEHVSLIKMSNIISIIYHMYKIEVYHFGKKMMSRRPNTKSYKNITQLFSKNLHDIIDK